mgnify:CR=1 FL=1
MDDKERIEYIILEKQLSNTEFCAKANIAPATLSHILGGRSKPSLAILRGVVMGFPDLNPEWVLLGIGNMYRENATSANIDTNDSSDSPISSNGTDGMFEFECTSYLYFKVVEDGIKYVQIPVKVNGDYNPKTHAISFEYSI